MFNLLSRPVKIKTNSIVCFCRMLEKPYKFRPTLNSRKQFLHSRKDLKDEKLFNDNNEIEGRVMYNSVIKHGRDKVMEKKFLEEKSKTLYETEGPPVLALKYFTNEDKEIITLNEKNSYDRNKQRNEEVEQINLPYKKHDHVTFTDSHEELVTVNYDVFEDARFGGQWKEEPFSQLKDQSCKRPKRKWMKDYEKYTEVPVKNQSEEEEEEDEGLSANRDVNYGSADPKIPVSLVPCGGCGAHLHCQDSAIPGYLPKELFVGLRDEQLQALVCQRCHFLREYNTALSVSVDPQIYPQLLSKVKSKMALVILVVDMTDFPCSIWPGILDIIGPKRPLVVVGNKIDLLQDWSKDWLERAKKALVSQLPAKANLLHTALISAKTGYGVEQLVTSLYNLWEYRGDVYLVGCTNVGKSTLFNALLQSDYCKTKAVNLVQRATTAPWPGTTLNLLKFPILRPEGWKLAVRSGRLNQQGSSDLKLIQEGKPEPTPQMITQINRTFSHGNTDRRIDDYWEDPFAMPKLATLRRLKTPGSGLDPSDPVFALSKWLYDTPGVVTPDQIIDLLTTEELVLTLPQKPIMPRTFQVWPGQSLLVAGLGRLDYSDGPGNIKMTVLAASSLPVTICWMKDTEDVYHHYLGSEALAVPCGSKDRLRAWPGLQAGPQFVLKGDGWKESCGDVVLSSAGWIAVTAQQDSMCQLQAWTPGARGIHVRIPPVLPRAIAVKGSRWFKTQAYALFNKYHKRKR